MEKKINDNAIHDEYYIRPNILLKKKWLLGTISTLFFLTIFFYQLSPKEKILVYIQKIITEQRKCKPYYKNIELNFLLPELIFHDLYLQSNCTNDLFDNVQLKLAKFSLAGISFSPIGLKWKMQIVFHSIPLDIYFILGLGNHKIVIENQKYPLNELNSLFNAIQLKGDVDINAQININGESEIESYQWKIQSKNLTFPNFAPSVTPSSFPPGSMPISVNLGKLDFNQLDLDVDYSQANQVIIKKFILGDKKSLIQLDLLGKIDANKINFLDSKINLTVKLKFDPTFLQKNSFLNLLLPSEQGGNGSYHFKLEDTLQMPRQRPL